MYLGVIQVQPQYPIGSQEFTHQWQACMHEREPGGVFHPVVVMFKRLPGIERRINIDASDLAPVFATVFGNLSPDPPVGFR